MKIARFDIMSSRAILHFVTDVAVDFLFSKIF